MTLVFERVGAEAAAEVLGIVRAAFSARPPLDPPADALGETEGSLKERLSGFGGVLARLDGVGVGAVVMDPADSTMWLRRFAVLPDQQGHGVAHKMVTYAAGIARAEGFDDLAVIAREELPETLRFWVRQGFREVSRAAPAVRLHRPLNEHVVEALDADAMFELGRRVAALVAAGDVLVLSGGLGAGKTTFTKGLGAGLGVRGEITSPTFVIARVHPSTVGGPELVHVDAYRLGGMDELDDLDLDTDLDDAVTVVEWGEGLAEGLSDSRLEIRIVRAEADEAPLDLVEAPDGADPRRVEIVPVGARWRGVDLSAL
ncbi:tRNA (adenosine(37)-N6)-threonylcarbamoyltransferase complex ATPase subunit type 1 TsaE [Nocardioides sp. KC13]|uniref:tRNA threonylcarbamoyladenosine biosynthesis protein TsaE n=1 Tax=Nocardioides turkmenicus TaxID=2711220 RepID=A0A6M1R2L7_9ACTN|nr:tRNA (adenosine(37)-N6)-threonylcarbamoyltransferase complex ATPase subunit type 1 TsaE [Nocardioides sp. KC13]NGN92961.1 tRNA (adenosine(37)-N6)-threonylcarbamoyltransferase complex ATPase subunit type 1 TsaE [Nocardioides sp. KC13]